MKNLIACNPGSYGKYRAGAYAHLSRIGVKHLELPRLTPADVPQAREELSRHGLSASTLMAPCEIGGADVAQAFEPSAAAAAAIGVPIIFVSAKAGDLPLDTAYARLRAVGDVAQKHGVKVAVETHPDLAHNGDVAARTMQGVDHPAVGINFDPGNIFYYNEGVDPVAELRKILPYVISVHLKDSGGGFHGWDFPALGRGKVDFPEIFRLLNERGLYGPFTMELEGVEGETLTEEQTQARVAESVEYLKRIGAMG